VSATICGRFLAGVSAGRVLCAPPPPPPPQGAGTAGGAQTARQGVHI